MATFNYSTETLDGITYYSAVVGKSTTTIFVMSGATFVGVNMSPVKALQDIAKHSKAVVGLLAVMEEDEKLKEKTENPRYTAFKTVKPNGKNYEFLEFIADMKNKYFGCKDATYRHIRNQDDFTAFINKQVSV